MTVAECAKLLGSKDGILLLTHKNPDGDTVMSAAALCRALRRKNKKAYLPQLVSSPGTYTQFPVVGSTGDKINAGTVILIR